MNLVQTALAFFEGIGLAFSPCILPILPFMFAASLTGGKLRPLQIVSGFILSFSFFSLLSRQLLFATGVHLDQIQWFAYLLLLILGFIMLVPPGGTICPLHQSISQSGAAAQQSTVFRTAWRSLCYG